MLVAIRDEVNKAIEQARNEKVINSELEAAIVITAPAESYKLLERYRGQLNALFVVSSVELKLGASTDGAVAVEASSRARPEVRTLLELLDARRRKLVVSHHLRTLLRRA